MEKVRSVEFLRSQWLKTLRSGHYQQGREYLLTQPGQKYARPDSKHPEGHCVLGVMCEVFFAFHREWGWETFGLEGKPNTVIPSADLPPAAILDAFDVPPGFAFDLARMNDRGYSFTRLADHLEAVWARDDAA